MKKLIRIYWGTGVILLAVLVLWEYCTGIGKLLNPVLFPTPSEVFTALWTKKNELFDGFISSMGLFLPGYFLALLLGIGGGLFFGLNRKIRNVLMPIFHGISPIPPTLYTPYAIALFPTFKTASIFLIFAGAIWPILLGTIQGVLLIDQRYLDSAKTLGLKGMGLLTKVILPASLPLVFNGAGVALIMSFIILTVAEMFGAKEGMGYFIQYYTDFSEYKSVLAGMIFNSLVILVIMILFEKLQKRFLFWTQFKRNSGN